MKNDFEIRGEVTAIFLDRKDGSRAETIIDTEDLQRASEFEGKWCIRYDPKGNTHYVSGYTPYVNGRRKQCILHRWIMGNPVGYDVDHINHNTLDNRRSCNLRLLTHKENNQNRSGLDRHNTSGIRGISWHKASGKWRAQIKVDQRCIHLGLFESKEQAAEAMRKAQEKYHPYAQASSI